MLLYLNPPRPFWQIPETNIALMRANPVREISDAELAALTTEQSTILQKSLDLGVVCLVDKAESIKKNDVNPLNFSAMEIQRKHVAPLVLKGKQSIPRLTELLALEEASESPRQDVITIIKNGIARIKAADPTSLEQKFYDEIVQEDIVIAPVVEPAPKKAKTRRNKFIEENS